MAMLRGYFNFLITISVFPYLTSTSAHQVQCGQIAAENRSEQIQSIAQYILNQLGYTQPPNAPSEIIPEDERIEYDMQNQRETNTNAWDRCNPRRNLNAITVKSIQSKRIHLQSASGSGSGSDSKRASGDHIGGDVILASYDIEFNINPNSILEENPNLVELVVYKEKYKSKQDDLFQLVEVIDKSNTSLGKVIAVELINVFSPKGYVSFNVTKAAARWVNQGLKKIDLVLTVKCISSWQCDLRSENQVKFNTSSEKMKLPRLIVEKDVRPRMLQNKRKRRSSHYKFCSNSSQICCLRNLTVNFAKDLGWNFVKLPTEIHVNYCGGLCPLGVNATPTHFELLASIHSSNYPCCSGASYEPVTMLVGDGNGKSKVLELPKMTVTSCQCA